MEEKIFGMEPATAVRLLMILLVLLIAFVLFLIYKINIMSRKYEALTSGKKANAKRINREHRVVKGHLSSCINKYALVKYDAFDQMAGKLSFVITLLNENNSGIVLNSMHSREGCFTYAKEIVNGESYIPLSDEEKEALERAKTVEEEIKDLTTTEEDLPE